MNEIGNILNVFGGNTTAAITALLVGLIPSFIWLRFWLNEEDKNDPAPRGLLFICFILGMCAVIFTIPLQKLVAPYFPDPNVSLIVWVLIEEIIKMIAVFLVALRSAYADEPVTYPIFFMTVALGFAALENTLFLFGPISENQATVSLITGNLRFLGATLLHSISSGVIGIMLGLSFFQGKFIKTIALLFGLALATALHAAFNFFIMDKSGSNYYLQIFGALWVVTIITMLMYEKLRRMGEQMRVAQSQETAE